VPLHSTTTAVLREYADKIAPTRRPNAQSGQRGGGARFFTLPGGGPLPSCNVHHAFRQVTTWTGTRTEHVWPRIHDLRHYADGGVMCPAVVFRLVGRGRRVLLSA